MKDGTITEQGSHAELLAGVDPEPSKMGQSGETKPSSPAGEYASLVRLYQEQLATQETKSYQNQLDEECEETTQTEVVSRSDKRLIDEGFPARAPGETYD